MERHRWKCGEDDGREKRDIEQRERKEGEPVEEREGHDNAIGFESPVCEDP